MGQFTEAQAGGARCGWAKDMAVTVTAPVFSVTPPPPLASIHESLVKPPTVACAAPKHCFLGCLGKEEGRWPECRLAPSSG